jgi:hypothetical protein
MHFPTIIALVLAAIALAAPAPEIRTVYYTTITSYVTALPSGVTQPNTRFVVPKVTGPPVLSATPKAIESSSSSVHIYWFDGDGKPISESRAQVLDAGSERSS